MNERIWFRISVLIVASLILVACGGSASTVEPIATEMPAATAAPTATEPPPISIAMLYTGQVTVGAWNIAIYEGAVAAEESVPNLQIVEAENVDYANAAELVRQYGEEGYDLILGTSAGYEAALREVAPEYPESFFVNYSDISTTDDLPNLAGYKFAYQETGYLIGLTAALLTDSNKIGIVASLPVPAVNNMINGAQEAIRLVNPDIEVLVGFTQDFNDLAKGSEIALAQIDDGADVIVNFAGPGGDGSIQVACDNDTIVTGYVVDQHDLCPDYLVVSWIIDHPTAILSLINDFVSGDVEPGIHPFNIANGGLGISPFYNVSEEVVNQVTEAYNQLKSGELTVEPNPEAP